MGDSLLYRSALARSLTPDERTLLETCLARSEQVEALTQSLPEMILANRSRREGREVTLTKSQLRTIRSAERDSAKEAAELPELFAAIPSVHLLLETALGSERNALRLTEAIWTGGHPEDEVLVKRQLELRSANIAEIEAFLVAAKLR